jgi:hypothetical protein
LHIANLHYQAIGKSGRHADLRLLNAAFKVISLTPARIW